MEVGEVNKTLRCVNANELPAEIAAIQGHGEFVFQEAAVPRERFVYFLILENAVQYIGKTKNLNQRLVHHMHWIEYDRVLCIECDEEVVDGVERYWISKLEPPRNAEYTSRSGVKIRNDERDHEIVAHGESVSTSVAFLNVPVSVKRSLFFNGITTAEELLATSYMKLLALRNVGEHRITQLMEEAKFLLGK